MHSALVIQEILFNIFGHCYPPNMQRAISGLAALARTCRTFKEPALDVLWEVLDDLAPLAQCLPQVSHQLGPGNMYSYARPLTEIEWDILQSYTYRIRSILNFKGLSQTSLAILSSPPTTKSLFPNLRHLHCDYTTEAMHLLHLPLPSLTSLNVNFQNPDWFKDSLESFPKFSPNITRLSLYVDESDATFDKVVSNCICHWRNLQTVICPLIALDMDALAHLSRMTTLTRLTFKLSAALLAPDSPLSFPKLRELALHSKSLALPAVSRLLSQTRLPVITDFTAFIGSCPSRDDISSFASAETSGLSYTVQGLRLHQSVLFSNDHDTEVLLLGFDDLRPCMAFSNLRRLDINIRGDVGLTDSDLLTLTSAWPHLEQLFINLDWGWNVLGGITPNGLLQLLQMCRSLCQVALAIDTRGYTECPRFGKCLGLTLPRTFSIDVLDSFIGAESVPAIAAFFAGIAPCVDFFFCAWDSWIMVEAPGWRIYKERWDDVYYRTNQIIRLRS